MTGLIEPATSIRRPAVAGSFYPADPARLRALVTRQLAEADVLFPRRRGDVTTGRPDAATGWLVPHAGLEYSGVVAAAAWRLLPRPPAAAGAGAAPPTVVILGTNHRAAWLDGIGIWPRGAWETPLGPAVIDADLAAAIVDLGSPFVVDLDAHLDEHSIEVQLPFLVQVAPTTRIVPLAVASGIGRDAIDAGARLGALLAARRGSQPAPILAISSDMAHYPSAADAAEVTAGLLPALLRLDPEALAAHEVALRQGGIDGLACGMCGIEPAVVGLAALRAAGAAHGLPLAAATSADSGGPADRAVGYLAVAFTR